MSGKQSHDQQSVQTRQIEDLPLEASTQEEVKGGMKGEAPTMS